MSADGERWRQVRDLFDRFVDDAPSDVERWLDRQGESDRQVRAEVISLARCHERAGTFLVEPIADVLPHLLSDEPLLHPGQQVGSYAIVREIGRGGMGRVYLATDHRLGRQVALKALSPDLMLDASQRERLRREARAAAALSHPGICTVYALEEIGGDIFIATEFIDGRTVRAEIDSGARPTPADVLRTARDLAAALAAAHVRGITHRDLKPGNVMRTADGRLKILDFGLARVDPASSLQSPTVADRGLTQPGALIGTPAYMAPEQINGRPADARADVFAFGIVIYEYACGLHPFEAATPLAMAGRILEGDPTPLATRRPDLSPNLVRVVERCLRKNAADRFASAEAILAALHSDESAAAPDRVAAWWRAHQATIMAIYFGACALTWQIKEWQSGVAASIFVVTGVASMIGGFFRSHVLFIERVDRPHLLSARRGAAAVTLAVDLIIGVALAVDGLLLLSSRPVLAVLSIALGLGIALARLVVEPSTTRAAFEN